MWTLSNMHSQIVVASQKTRKHRCRTEESCFAQVTILLHTMMTIQCKLFRLSDALSSASREENCLAAQAIPKSDSVSRSC